MERANTANEVSLPLEPATLVRRYKRFLADVTLPTGEVDHCPLPEFWHHENGVYARITGLDFKLEQSQTKTALYLGVGLLWAQSGSCIGQHRAAQSRGSRGH